MSDVICLYERCNVLIMTWRCKCVRRRFPRIRNADQGLEIFYSLRVFCIFWKWEREEGCLNRKFKDLNMTPVKIFSSWTIKIEGGECKRDGLNESEVINIENNENDWEWVKKEALYLSTEVTNSTELFKILDEFWVRKFLFKKVEFWTFWWLIPWIVWIEIPWICKNMETNRNLWKLWKLWKTVKLNSNSFSRKLSSVNNLSGNFFKNLFRLCYLEVIQDLLHGILNAFFSFSTNFEDIYLKLD